MRPHPDHVAALACQALLSHQNGDLHGAEVLYLRVIASDPNHRLSILNLCLILSETGRTREAERRLERLVKQAPDDAAAHLLLGRLLGANGRATRSLFLLRRGLALAPDRLDAWLDAIAALGQQRRPDEAEALASEAMQRFDAEADLAVQAGLAQQHNERPEKAGVWFARALGLAPEHPLAHHQVAMLLEQEGDFAGALRHYRQAYAADKAQSLPRMCLGDLELRLGDIPAAIASLDAWLSNHPQDATALSNRMMAAQYVPGVTAMQLHDLHTLWENSIGRPLRSEWEAHEPHRDPERQLRIGLVSGDLRSHAVGHLTIPAIENLDRTEIEITVYADLSADDAIAQRFRGAASRWRETEGWSDETLCATIRADAIDILIDMSGHTTNIRLAAFARKPAPVQLSWAGYFGTTGCAAIDGLIVDRHLVPEGEEHAYVEQILRLPDGYLCYDPPADAPEPMESSSGSAPLALAAFHHPAKINAEVAALWARILAQPPLQDAILHFTYAGYETPEVQGRIAGWFAMNGTDTKRLRFHGRLSRPDYFTALGKMDIALDPFPYSGGAITCDALWMGVPVVTLPGATVAGRHTQSHLHAAGQPEWVARDADDYVAIVSRLAANRPPRRILRESVQPSPLCDGQSFGRNLTRLLREAWRNHT